MEDACFSRFSEGDRVSVEVCGEYEELSAAEWGLVPEEYSGMTLRASPMRIEHPLRYQHRRMLLAVAEAGLAVPFKKHWSLRKNVKTGEPSDDVVVLFCFVYTIGVLVSAMALMSEFRWHKRVNTSRQSVAGRWRLRLPWTKTTTARPFSA
ncbi:hypothetical protein MRX96_058376 [Rhipicephalus microplus]